MTTLCNALARVSVMDLQAALGHDSLKAIELLDPQLLQSSRLAQFCIERLGVDDILLDKKWRSKLFDAMRQVDAEDLCRRLGKNPDNSYQELAAMQFRTGDKSIPTLYEYFELEMPVAEDEFVPVPCSLCIPKYPLFTHQIEALARCMSILERGEHSRVLLHMPTGSGKTRTAMNIVSQYLIQSDCLVIWLAHSGELCDQAAVAFEEAWTCLGNRPVKLHRAYGEHGANLREIDTGFVVASLALMHQRSFSEQSVIFSWLEMIRLVVMDEAHQAIAPTYKLLLDLLAGAPTHALLGLSATPGRTDASEDEAEQLACFFDKKKVTLDVDGFDNPVEYLIQEGYLAKAEYDFVEYLVPDEFRLTLEEVDAIGSQTDLSDEAIQRLGRDQARNILIIDRIKSEIQHTESKMLVFACSVDHVHVLQTLLSVNRVNSTSVTSRSSPKARRRAIEEYRSGEVRVLINYGILTTGFDEPSTDAVLIARPTQSVVLHSQMVGRAIRGPEVGGNDSCKVITVVDRMPGFSSVAEGFEFWNDIWSD